MRISDWSSDVCSSDLLGVSPQFVLQHLARRIARQFVEDAEPFGGFLPGNSRCGEMVAQFVERQRRARHQHNAGAHDQIGRASCRDRVCQYVSISVVAVSLKKNKENTRKKIKEP